MKKGVGSISQRCGSGSPNVTDPQHWKKNFSLLAFWKPLTKRAGSGFGSESLKITYARIQRRKKGYFKGTVVWDGFFGHIVVSKIYDKDLKFFLILANFGFFLRIRRMRQDFSTSYDYFIGSKFQSCEMASYIWAVREPRMQLKFLACLIEKFHCVCVFSLCAKWVKSCPNPVNISTTWKKFSILSFYLW